MSRWILCALVGLVGCAGPTLAAPPMAAKYLYEGKLADGEKALLRHLEANAADDEARFGLGAIQFLRAFEKLGSGLYKYGLRTNMFTRGMSREQQRLMPFNNNPEKLDYTAFRKLVQEVVDSLDTAARTLGSIKDDKVKLPLEVGKIKIDFWGRGEPFSAALLFRQFELKEEAKVAGSVIVGFDRGDVAWLKGYCHVLAGLGEILQSLDAKETFETTAHAFFANVETPYEFLQEDYKDLDLSGFGSRLAPAIADTIQLLYHALNQPIGEPERFKKALAHFEAAVEQAEVMWTHILAEKDDDNEWIPNPGQTGVLKIRVTNDMVKAWRGVVLGEVKDILAGKKLLPFWRGKPGARGVNLRKVFLNPPKRLDVTRLIQGTALTPYLEKGTVTKLADLREIQNLDRIFGGPSFFGFAAWFN